MNHQQTKKLKQIRLRVGKAQSSFVYFTLEANEGLAFYSTLDDSVDTHHRDLIVYTTPEYFDPLMQEFEHLQAKAPLEILSIEEVDDF